MGHPRCLRDHATEEGGNEMMDHIKSHVLAYVVPVVCLLLWGGFMSYMDERHEPVGAVQEAQADMKEVLLKKELRALKREKRKLETYQRLSPNSEYSESRQAEIADLADEIDEIEREL